MRTRAVARSRAAVRALATWALVAAATLLSACGAGDFVPDTGRWDGGPLACTAGTGGDSAVALRCPGNIDLGCVSSSGRRAFFSAPAPVCATGTATVRCTQMSGATFMPGDTRVRCEIVGADGGGGGGGDAAVDGGGDAGGPASAACDFVVSAGLDGNARLRCMPTVEVECAGAATRAMIPDPMVDRACGSPSGTITNDAPAAGFPAGNTDVTFRMGPSAPCTTRVSVVDRVPPPLDCSQPATALRLRRGEAIEAPALPAMDACSGAATVVTDPPRITAHGALMIPYIATDAAGNAANCMRAVTISNAWGAPGLRVAHAQLNGTGPTATTAVTLVWDHLPDSDVTTYRIERANSPMGPWTMAGTTPAATPRFVEAMLSGGLAYYRVVSLVGTMMGGISDVVSARSITATSYDLGMQPIPGFRLPANAMSGAPETTSSPLRAVVRHPSDLAAGPYPLVLLLHGNHGNCRPGNYDASGRNPNLDDACTYTNDGSCRTGTPTPNAEGLVYLAETLASHGYVVASVNANAVNCREAQIGSRVEGYITHRGLLLIEHLRRWRAWNTSGGAPFANAFMGRVDLSRVGLYGHSRGAEAVAHVPGQMTSATDVAGITVGSVFSLAPTNFDNPQVGSVPFATLVPICDGDVFTYDGVSIYDRTRRVSGALRPAVQLFVGGTDHNFFSSEWRFDDNAWGVPSCSAGNVQDPGVHRGTLETSVSSWFDGTLVMGGAIEPWMRASGDVPPGITFHSGAVSPLDIRRSYASPRVARVDNFEDSDNTTNLLGGANASMGAFASSTPAQCTGNSNPACDRTYSLTLPWGNVLLRWPHFNGFGGGKSGLLALWDGADAAWTADLGSTAMPDFDASGYRVLSLRVASRSHASNSVDLVDQDFTIRVHDAADRVASARASEIVTIPHVYESRLQRAVLQTVRIDLQGLAQRSSPPLDLRRLRRLEIRFDVDGHAGGALVFSDFEFAE